MTNELYTDNLTCPFHLNSPTQKEARLRALITEVWPPVVDDALFLIFSPCDGETIHSNPLSLQ